MSGPEGALASQFSMDGAMLDKWKHFAEGNTDCFASHQAYPAEAGAFARIMFQSPEPNLADRALEFAAVQRIEPPVMEFAVQPKRS